MTCSVCSAQMSQKALFTSHYWHCQKCEDLKQLREETKDSLYQKLYAESVVAKRWCYLCANMFKENEMTILTEFVGKHWTTKYYCDQCGKGK